MVHKKTVVWTFVLTASHLAFSVEPPCDFHKVAPPQMMPAAPEAPPAPTRPRPAEPRPVPLPEHPAPRPSEPAPRRLPDRRPDRPVQPTKDPQNIEPFQLHTLDPRYPNFWEEVPVALRDHLQRSYNEESQRLKELTATWGVTDLPTLMRNHHQVKQQIAQIEGVHREKLEALLKRMVSDVYGPEVANSLDVKIGGPLPAWPEIPKPRPVDRFKDWFKRAKDSFTPAGRARQAAEQNDMQFMRYRRELYNMLSQAHGYYGTQRLYSMYEKELKEIDPNLPELLRKDLTLAMYGNDMMIQNLRPHQLGRFSNRRNVEGMAHGRNVTEATVERKQDEEGSYLEVKDKSGVAVGNNTHDAAHEAAKAGFKIATVNETSTRATLNPPEQKWLDDATNSPVAEIRQGVFGPYLDRTLRRSIRAMLYPDAPSKQLTEQQYLTVVERVFSELPPGQFHAFIEGAGDPAFEKSPERIQHLRTTLGEFDILPQVGGN